MHALERAKERYNLDLDKEDLCQISKRCFSLNNVTKMYIKDAHGHLKQTKGSEGPYKLVYKDTLVWVILLKSKNKRDKRYYVGTFLPLPKDKNENFISSKIYREVNKELEES